MQEQDRAIRVYEFSYLLVPTIAEEAVPEVVVGIKSKIESEHVSFISEESPKLITLAYPMYRTINNKKVQFTNGYFGWLKFEAMPETAEALTKAFERDESIIRFLTIKTVSESTLAPKKLTERGSRRKDGSEAPAAVVAEKAADAPAEEPAVDEALTVEA